MSPTDRDSAAIEVGRATRAVYATFIAAGFAYASWAARIPQIKEHLDVTPAMLGLVLLCNAVGSLVSMPVTGFIVTRIGEARTVAIMAAVGAVGLAGVALGYQVGAPFVAASFVVVGFGNGAWDVSMNVHAAEVERALGRSIMSRFHAGFSVGTVTGAGVSALLVALHVPVTVHLLGIAALVFVGMPFVTRGFLPRQRLEPSHESRAAAIAAWREPRTLLVGVFVLCAAFSEGTGNDWIGLAAIDGYGMSNTAAALTLACFLVAMTTGRWFGPALIDRYGRVKMLRACGVLSLAGLALVVSGRAYPIALIGVLLWGLGTSLGFPTGMSAAADDPAHAGPRVSVVSTIAYFAFLAGPPTVGFVGNHVGVLRSLSVAAALVVVALLLSARLAAPEPEASLDIRGPGRGR